MSEPMTHDAARDLLAMAALDALAPSERAALEAHLGTCAGCTADLAALRDGVAAVGNSLRRRPLAPERESLLRAQLTARAAADRENVTPIRRSEARRSSGSASTTQRQSTNWRMLAAAALILAVAGVIYGREQRATGIGMERFATVLMDSTKALHAQLAEQQAIVAELTGPGVKVIDAAATGSAKPYARMFWDQPTNHWTFVAHNLPAPQPGHTYQLWMITRDQQKLSAGTFVPTANGSAIVRTTYPLASDSLAAIAVTNEPVGGSVQPTTAPFLVGAARTD